MKLELKARGIELDRTLRDAIDRGWVAGPRMQCAGAYITSPGGGGDVTGLAPEEDALVPPEMRLGVVRSADDVRRRGIALLDPVLYDRPAWTFEGYATGPGAGARAGCAAVASAAKGTPRGATRGGGPPVLLGC